MIWSQELAFHVNHLLVKCWVPTPLCVDRYMDSDSHPHINMYSRSGRQYVLKEMDALNMTEQERGKALREVLLLVILTNI